jgi:hypothetical protein
LHLMWAQPSLSKTAQIRREMARAIYSININGVMGKPLEQRFWAQVNKRGPSECWEWSGHKSHGYGYISVGNKSNGTRKELRANRVCWEFDSITPIPAGKVVMHLCDNRACVNPSHLQLGTQSENLKDAFRKGRHSAPRLKGVDSPKAKLTEDQVDTIRFKLSSGWKQIDLAREYGVCKGTISHIWTGRNWRG